MATLSVSGLTTGIDYNSLIEQLINVERVPINRLESRKAGYEQKAAAYADLSTKLDALEAAAAALRSSSGFADKTVTVSDPTILTADAGSSATTGDYSLIVSELALSHKLISGNGLASEDGTIASGAGQFRFKIGESGTEYAVDVDAETTLEELKDALNALDVGLNAVIIDEGQGATPYRLILSSEDTGATNKIIVTQDDTNLGFPVNDTTLVSALHIQKPQDAEIELDGFTVYRSGNTVTDLIPGVTLFLHKAQEGSSVALQVSQDRAGITAKIQTLIDSYNEVVTYISGRSDYDTEEHTADPLYAEGTVRAILRRMGSIVSSGVSGLPAELKALSQIGVSTQRDGTLALDQGELQDALDEDPAAVTNLFIDGAATEGVAEKLYQMAFAATRSEDGDLAIRIEGLSSRMQSLETKIREQEAALERYEVRLRAQFAALESLISSTMAQDQFFSSATNS
ncbi:MAG: flagellar filament capping protein FliD [bacterium]